MKNLHEIKGSIIADVKDEGGAITITFLDGTVIEFTGEPVGTEGGAVNWKAIKESAEQERVKRFFDALHGNVGYQFNGSDRHLIDDTFSTRQIDDAILYAMGHTFSV